MEIENVCLGSLPFVLLAKLLTEGAYSKGEGLVAGVACVTEQSSQCPRPYSFYALTGHGFLEPLP